MMYPKINLCLSTAFFGEFHSALSKIDFVRTWKPILEHNCVSCHREDNAKGKVRLDDKASAFAGDDGSYLASPKIARFTDHYFTRGRRTFHASDQERGKRLSF